MYKGFITINIVTTIAISLFCLFLRAIRSSVYLLSIVSLINKVLPTQRFELTWLEFTWIANRSLFSIPLIVLESFG